jgi:hypothetical protein
MVGRLSLLLILASAMATVRPTPGMAQTPDISGVYRSGRAETPCGRGDSFGPTPECPVNDLGIAAHLRATPETDPGLECIADGLSRQFTRLPRPMEIIQLPDRVILHYEYFDVWRVVHLNRDSAPSGTPHSLTGFSTGRWEGETLVVETSHLVENVHTIPTSDQMTAVERYHWNDEHNVLLLDVVINDPGYYDGPLTFGTAEFIPNPGDYIAQWVCTNQSELFYGDINAFFDEN